jgi:hypothetical protein
MQQRWRDEPQVKKRTGRLFPEIQKTKQPVQPGQCHES